MDKTCGVSREGCRCQAIATMLAQASEGGRTDAALQLCAMPMAAPTGSADPPDRELQADADAQIPAEEMGQVQAGADGEGRAAGASAPLGQRLGAQAPLFSVLCSWKRLIVRCLPLEQHKRITS